MSKRDDDRRRRRRRRYDPTPPYLPAEQVYRVKSGSYVRRDPLRIARTWTPRPIVLPSRSLGPRSGRLSLIEDRRVFRPEIVPPLRGRRSVVRVVSKGRGVQFGRPEPTLCDRRRSRRQVMFASGQAGKRGQRPPRRNRWSHISCRR